MLLVVTRGFTTPKLAAGRFIGEAAMKTHPLRVAPSSAPRPHPSRHLGDGRELGRRSRRTTVTSRFPLNFQAGTVARDECQDPTIPAVVSTTPRTYASVFLALLMVLAVASCSFGQPSSAARTGQPAPRPSVTPSPQAKVRTSQGPTGVESTAIAAENKLPGATSWRITGQGHGVIEGFANKTYAAAGDTVDLHVSTDAPSFRVVAYRMGWYQGLGARQLWSSAVVPGHVQPACPVAPGTNMVSCDNWSRSLTMVVTRDFVPGDYLLKLVGYGNVQSYVLLTIWDPSSTATYLVMNRSLVEQGWNAYGGYSLYQGKGPCILNSGPYPVCNRARVVSFDRPYDVNGPLDFISNEYPLVQFMEEHGLDLTYCTDVCVSEHPSILLRHRAMIGLDHDETWTNSERVAAMNALHAGVNMAFLGAATLVRHARLQASPLGPDREEVDYRNSQEDPLNGRGDPMEVTGNTWSSPPTNWNSSSFVGQIYSGFLKPNKPSAPLVVWDASAWIFKGTSLARGQSIPAVINSDIDHIDPSGPIPPNLQVLAHSPIPLSEAYTSQGKWGNVTYSDMTYYTDPRTHAGVFDSGDNTWVATLNPCPSSATNCPRSLIRTMTGNLLWLFGQGPAGRFVAPIPNWRNVSPPGS